MSGLHSLPALGLGAAQTKIPSLAPGPKPSGHGLLLAQWLEAISAGEATGLAEAFANSDGDLAACFAGQFPNAKKHLAQRLGTESLPEIFFLAQESDPELFAQGWLNLARRQQGAGRFGAAVSIYEALANSDLGLRERAQKELDAVHGRGSAGARAEFLLGQFAAQASDPGMLGGMMLASTAFQGVRLVGLSRLLAAPEATWLTRGAGARALASTLGFAAEVPTFLFASKGIHQLMAREQDWSARALGQEGLSLGVTLLFLKGFAAAGRRGVQSLHHEFQGGASSSAFTRISAELIPQTASLAGIYFGHRAESALGLKPHLDGATTLTDSLVFLLQFHVGGKLSGALMGPGFASGVRRMEWLSETLTPPAKPVGGSWSPVGPRLLPIAAGPGGAGDLPNRLLPQLKWTEHKPGLLMMSQLGTGEASSYKFLERRLLHHLMEWLAPGPEADAAVRDRFPRLIDDIGESYLKTPSVDLQRYFQLLMDSRLRDVPHEDGRVTTRVEQLSVAVKCFSYIMEMNPLRRAVGSHYDHLMQEAFERTLKDGTVGDFDALVRIASVSRRIESVEAFLQERGWAERYAFLPEVAAVPKAPASWLDRVRERLGIFRRPPESPQIPAWQHRLRYLSLSPETRRAVERYLTSFGTAEAAAAFRDPSHNFILWRPQPRDERREAFTPEVAVEGLADYLQTWKSKAAYQRVLEDAIRRAAASPVPLLHFDRIFKVLSTRDLPHKIAEVASSEEFDWGRLQGFLELSQEEPGFASTSEKLNGTIYTGYIYDRILAEKFALLYQNSGLFLREHEDHIRLGRFHKTVEHLLNDVSKYSREDVIKLLRLDAGPDAPSAIQALERGQADIKMVSREELRRLWESLPAKRRVGNHPRVVFVPPSQNGGRRAEVVVAKKTCFDEADVLYMLKLQPTPVADQARKAIERGEIDLQVLTKAELREFHNQLDPASKDEAPPKAFYVPAKKSPHGRPIIVVEALDPHLTSDQKIWQSIFLPAQTVHEFEHHLHREMDDVFLSEMRAWLEETYFLMYNGDLRGWREMQETSPYGFGVYLRNLVDKNYIEGPRHVSRKK